VGRVGAPSLSSRGTPDGVKAWGLIVPLALFSVNWLLGPLFEATLGWSFAARVLVSGAVLVPAGFLMGFPFPIGMAACPEEHKPWLWAINGAASVLASVFSLALSMQFGFKLTTICGVAFYLIAFVILLSFGAGLTPSSFGAPKLGGRSAPAPSEPHSGLAPAGRGRSPR
jgi:hypothetical protein